MNIDLEIAARWYFHTSDGKRWAWRYDTARLRFDLPPWGSTITFHLPPLVFTYSAADLVRMNIWNGDAGPMFNLIYNGYQELGPNTSFHISRLWSMMRFNSPMWDGDGAGKVWSFRWRTLNAPNDILTRVNEILAAAETLDDARTAVRREVTLYMLNIPNTGRSI